MCSNFSIDFQRYSQVRNKLRKLTRTLHTNYENKLVSNVKSNDYDYDCIQGWGWEACTPIQLHTIMHINEIVYTYNN